ncbi:MAG: DASS family sodium-coupled anion symporter, partial [Bacteroidota bacterium]
IERWNLHRRIALNIIYRLGTNPSMLVLGFMVATGLLSMWISNTATSLMMLPIGMAVVKQLSDKEAEAAMATPFAKALMLGIAYAASIGGTATLIGTPPNLIFAGIVQDLFGIEITFVQWFRFGLPFSVIMMSLCWWLLTQRMFKLSSKDITEGKEVIKQQLKGLGPISAAETWVLVIFSLTAFAWISRSYLLKPILPGIDDTIIGLIGATLLFMLPAPGQEGRRLLSWKDTQKLPWGILLLFGGGLALAAGFKQTDLATWLGDQLNLLMGLSLILVLLAVTAMINFLTEITSNLATASMIMPVVAALAISLGWHPYALMVPAILAASCAFMLPVATPPNAVAFGSGYLRMGDMIRAGVWLNLLSILLIVAWVYLYLPGIWDLDLQSVPAEFQLPQ